LGGEGGEKRWGEGTGAREAGGKIGEKGDGGESVHGGTYE